MDLISTFRYAAKEKKEKEEKEKAAREAKEAARGGEAKPAEDGAPADGEGDSQKSGAEAGDEASR